MQFAQNVQVLDRVNVFLSILEILTPDADLNVFKTLTVIGLKRVETISVKIPVQEFVALMLNAEFRIILLSVYVWLDMKVIRREVVSE